MNAANCEITISPPVDIMVIMANISQNTGVFCICSGATSGTELMTAAAGTQVSTSPLAGIAQAERGQRADGAENEAEGDERRLVAGTLIMVSIGNVVGIAPKP